jgi:quercetin dioxygenase-like cupin family protein
MSAAHSVRTIPDFSALSYDEKHILARKALIHQTDEVQINVYVLDPGGRIPPHRHSQSWDVSAVMEGEIEIRFPDDGGVRTIRCKRQAINMIPPGTMHEISNPSATEHAAFLLIQSPSKSFDFVRAAFPSAP